MDTNGIDQLLSQLQAASQSAGDIGAQPSAGLGGPGDFAALLQTSLEQVCNVQADAKQLALADYCQVVMCLNEMVYVE